MLAVLREKIGGANEALKKGLFVIGSTIIVFLALRNDSLMHLEQFWCASHTLWATLWGFLYNMMGESDVKMHIFGSTGFTFVVFILSNVFFLYADITGSPKWIHRYRIQSDRNVPVNWQKYKKAIYVSAFNSLVVVFVFSICTYPLAKWRGMTYGYTMPSFSTAVCHLLVYVVVEEIGFYYSHRLFHHPLLYKHFHKIHHEWTAPVAITSLYIHPVEYMLHLVPLFSGPCLMGSHFSVAYLWFAMASLSNTIGHSGYHLPFLSSPEAHDFHHLKFNQNYGALGVLDYLHGTNELFLKSKQYQRHFVLLGLSSAKELCPETKGKPEEASTFL